MALGRAGDTGRAGPEDVPECYQPIVSPAAGAQPSGWTGQGIKGCVPPSPTHRRPSGRNVGWAAWDGCSLPGSASSFFSSSRLLPLRPQVRAQWEMWWGGSSGAALGPCTPPALLSHPDAEKTPHYWNEGARRRLEAALALQPVAQRAKNIILFMGDGECSMGAAISHVTDFSTLGTKLSSSSCWIPLPLVAWPWKGRAGPSPVTALCHPSPQAWGCPRCQQPGSTRGNWPAARVRRASWPWRHFPTWPWPR